MITWFNMSSVYFDKRHPREPWCFNTNNSGLIEVHRFENEEAADATHEQYDNVRRIDRVS